jgi:hypothetical protein
MPLENHFFTRPDGTIDLNRPLDPARDEDGEMTTKVADELEELQKIIDAFLKLSDEQRKRVFQYLWSRFT